MLNKFAKKRKRNISVSLGGQINIIYNRIQMNTKELLQLHDDTCKACRVIMQQKNSDYTGGKGATDPFANFNASKILDIHPVQGLLRRVIDKIQRIRSFTNDKELLVPNETVADACDDIVNYAILAKAMLMEERSQIEQDSPNKEPYPYDSTR